MPNHPVEFRRKLAKLACEPGVSVARLAMEHGVNTNLLFKWRRALRAGEYDSVGFLPVVTFRHKGAGYFRHIGASRSG
ncbi:transposase [Burkholderia thailandensis]|nr:transposase [Burkholderia thailandensis]QRA12791.1 transposase [Burkholderia thailandensis]